MPDEAFDVQQKIQHTMGHVRCIADY